MHQVLFVLFALIALRASASSDEFATLRASFDAWGSQFDKVYADQTEYNYRLAVFTVNAKRVQQYNEQSNGGAIFSLNNRFADLTKNEFKKQFLGYKPVEKKVKEQLIFNTTEIDAAPNTFDWISKGKVTAVKNQGQCGSCWAFSATENIESVWMIAKGLTPANFKPLAPQQIVDCDTADGGCNGGDTITAYQYVIKADGQDTEASYPYKAVNQACHFKPADVEVRIKSYKYATTTHNEEEMKTATATVAPLSICVDAEPWQFYTGGVMTKAQCGNSLDHCVQITGYDTAANPPYWVVRNSWGGSWGEKGFIRLEFGTNTCGLSDEATTVVV